MKSVFVCGLILALAQHAFGGVCDNNVVYNSTLTTPCVGNDVLVLWPYYPDFGKYIKCVNFGESVLIDCPTNTVFCYVRQKCTDCTQFIPAPPCETLEKTTDVSCIPISTPTTNPTPTTKPTKPVTTPKPTKPGDTTSETNTPPTETTQKTTKPPPVTNPPTPPSVTSATDLPTPPIAVTPKPGVPTPPNQGATPPAIGTPPTFNPGLTA